WTVNGSAASRTRTTRSRRRSPASTSTGCCAGPVAGRRPGSSTWAAGRPPGRYRPSRTTRTGTPTAWTSTRTRWNAPRRPPPCAASPTGSRCTSATPGRTCGDYDLVLCVGSTHAFGGFGETLELAGRHVNADGVLMVGEGFWQVPPTPQALAALGAKPDDHTDLAGLVAAAEQAGWTPVYAHVSDAAEWDDYEWSWTGSLTEWALDNPGHPDAAGALATAREHRDQWLRGYRGVLGFVTLVLRRI
ncbi:LOW QUALITY PROTEIN: methyltransferase, partial [Micromonospora sp. M42]